jgi:hypothetical protein
MDLHLRKSGHHIQDSATSVDDGSAHQELGVGAVVSQGVEVAIRNDRLSRDFIPCI